MAQAPRSPYEQWEDKAETERLNLSKKLMSKRDYEEWYQEIEGWENKKPVGGDEFFWNINEIKEVFGCIPAMAIMDIPINECPTCKAKPVRVVENDILLPVCAKCKFKTTYCALYFSLTDDGRVFCTRNNTVEEVGNLDGSVLPAWRKRFPEKWKSLPWVTSDI